MSGNFNFQDKSPMTNLLMALLEHGLVYKQEVKRGPSLLPRTRPWACIALKPEAIIMPGMPMVCAGFATIVRVGTCRFD